MVLFRKRHRQELEAKVRAMAMTWTRLYFEPGTTSSYPTWQIVYDLNWRCAWREVFGVLPQR